VATQESQAERFPFWDAKRTGPKGKASKKKFCTQKTKVMGPAESYLNVQTICQKTYWSFRKMQNTFSEPALFVLNPSNN